MRYRVLQTVQIGAYEYQAGETIEGYQCGAHILLTENELIMKHWLNAPLRDGLIIEEK